MRMSIKLIALDMDGTTLQGDHASISLRTRRAIRAAIAKGILIVPATGRLNSLLPESVMTIEGIRYAITSNGAVTYDLKANGILYSNYIKQELVLDVIQKLPLDKMLVEIFKDGQLFVERKYLASLSKYPIPFLHLDFLKSIHAQVDRLPDFIRAHGERIEKINLPYVPPELRNNLGRELSGLKHISVTSSVPDNMEISGVNANKGTALQKLCGFLHIPKENVMALGDNGNDLEMLQFAGVSVAPANGSEEAKSAATAVTLANDEDGVALAIEKYALDH